MPILTFPETRQATSFSCGAASVQSILYYYGHEHKEADLVEALPTNPDHGTRPGDIVSYFVEHNLYVHAAKMTIEQVKWWIDRGVPVMLDIQAWTDNPNEDWATSLDDGHWVVAIGYDDEHVIFDDPSILGNRGYIPFAELDKRWHDVEDDVKYLKDHFGIAVFGQEPCYNPDKMLKIESDQSARRVAARWMAARKPA